MANSEIRKKYDEMVVFGDGLGGYVSNDPRFNAEEYETYLNPGESEKEPPAPYSDITGKDLAALAKDREISLKHEDGSKLSAAEVRAALVAQDEAKAAEEAANADQSNDDGSNDE